MQIGMPTLIENSTLEDNICLCKKLNLQFLELNMNFPEYQLHMLERTDEFYKIADKAMLYYTIHLDENLNIADFNQLVANAYLETVKRTIEVAKRMIPLRDKYGEKSQPLVVNMHMHHGIYITLPDRKVQMYDRDFDVYFDSFIKFRTLCEEWIGDYDIVVSIENTDGFREYEKTAIEYLLESPKFGLTWDIGHSKAIGETDVPFIMKHSNKLRHFHIHDGIAKSDKHKGRNHLALGDGEINIRERLSMAGNRNARCVLETKTIAALNRSVEYLKAYALIQQ
jgi:xylose isomerase domain protein TIM barrel